MSLALMEPRADSPSSPPHSARRPTGARLNGVVVVANILGALLYLWRASPSWTIPEERAAGITTVTGEPFIWGIGVLPVWGAFAMVNLVWLAVALSRRNSERRSAVAWVIVVSCWLVAFLIDRAHH